MLKKQAIDFALQRPAFSGTPKMVAGGSKILSNYRNTF
jgi:hypothetical protein